MTSFNKSYLDELASKHNFIRDNLEKVLRLAEILSYINKDDLLSPSLALKGGTAINLTIFRMPRLSVDIDLDYNINCSKEEMLTARKRINNLIMRYMMSEGYQLKPTSKNPLSLDSWVFGYTNAGGNLDSIKIEINYSNRCHMLPAVQKTTDVGFLHEITISILDPKELFASKINALISRGAMRDLYDVNNMLSARMFLERKEYDMLRRMFVLYHCIGASSKAEEVSLEFRQLPKIETITFSQVKAQLIPVLRKDEHFDYQEAKNRVIEFLTEFLQFDESEHEFVCHFNKREYMPELLFEDTDIVERIRTHPMALWKCRN